MEIFYNFLVKDILDLEGTFNLLIVRVEDGVAAGRKHVQGPPGHCDPAGRPGGSLCPQIRALLYPI